MERIIILITALLACLAFSANATIFTFNGPGNWDDATLWSPSYPGDVIASADEVIINDECTIISSVQNEGLITIEGSLIVAGPFIFVNTSDGHVVVNGELIIDYIMYNQGLTTNENSLTINHLFLNFTDLVNNGTIMSLGQEMNSSGTFLNNGTYIDEVGFFEQGSSDHQGIWEGNGSHYNDDFVGNDCTISPSGSGEIGDYTFFSNLVGSNILSLEIEGTGGAGIGHDKIIGLDEIDLSETSLEVYLNNGFEPQAGDSFEILSANNGITGDISDPYGNLPSLNTGLSWLYENDGAVVTLSVESTVAVVLCPLKAEQKEQGVQLSWCSYSEINHDYYQIERSGDASEWLLLDKQTGAGQSHTALDYSYFDINPLIGDNYYRLVSIDLDGHFEISDLAYISIDRHNQVRIWPLLFRSDDLISINVYELIAGDYEIKIYNHLGQKVFENSRFLDEESHIPLNADLSPGKYFLMIENDSYQITKSFLVH